MYIPKGWWEQNKSVLHITMHHETKNEWTILQLMEQFLSAQKQHSPDSFVDHSNDKEHQ